MYSQWKTRWSFRKSFSWCPRLNWNFLKGTVTKTGLALRAKTLSKALKKLIFDQSNLDLSFSLHFWIFACCLCCMLFSLYDWKIINWLIKIQANRSWLWEIIMLLKNKAKKQVNFRVENKGTFLNSPLLSKENKNKEPKNHSLRKRCPKMKATLKEYW